MIASTWAELNQKSIGSSRYWSIALQNATFHRDMLPLVRKYARGRVLDLGAGKLAWRADLSRQASRYVSADYSREHPDLDLIFDATRRFPLADGSFDTIFCCSVLEHCQEPWHAFDEMFRVLAPGGVAILSVPFAFYLHGLPHDYYRFTPRAVRYLSEKAGFDVVEQRSNGNLADLILNGPSILSSCAWHLLGLDSLIKPTTMLFLALSFLASSIDRRGLLAMNQLAVLRRPLR